MLQAARAGVTGGGAGGLCVCVWRRRALLEVRRRAALLRKLLQWRGEVVTKL